MIRAALRAYGWWVVVLVLAPHVLPSATPSAWADEPPSLNAATTSAEVGDLVTVKVRNFAATRVQVELCGSRGTGTSADCDSSGGGLVSTVEGAGSVTLRIAVPPGGCPCRLRAHGLGTTEVAAVPYLVHGAPLDERPEGTGKPAHERVPVPRTVTVMAGLVAPGPIERVLQWAGADARRYVDVVVHNTGERPLRRAAVHLWAGRESAALAVGEPQAVATIPLLEPGEEWSARLPVDLPGTPPVGRYAVVGSVVGATSGGEFGAHVSTMPVIPILLAVALAVALPLGLARRLRRWGDRRRGREPRPVGAPWLIGMAASVALVAVSLLVREQWIQRSDRLAAEAAQSDLLTEFSARREALATPEAEALGAERRLGDLVSVIRLPDRTSWAVVEGVGDDQLLRGPGHYPGTAWPGEVGNSVVAGHSGFAEAPFDRLATVRPGERITLESPDATHVYVVHRVREVEETAMSVLLPVRDEPGAEPTSAELTLITCSYDGGVISGRWIVEATMESVN